MADDAGTRSPQPGPPCAGVGWTRTPEGAALADITVTRNDDASRYEIHHDGTLAGFAEFDRRPGEIRFTHTEVDPAFEGKGLAGRLVQDALADAVASRDTIVPYCPYVRRYLETHDVPGADVRWPKR
ncbi:N-acetyltransferase [Microbacterium sp. EF45047]|nr:N-acetyltransferase [Microbacterium neungamense]WCM56747.1 N-acetyltransferase [Microbacterium sp. EF45047]